MNKHFVITGAFTLAISLTAILLSTGTAPRGPHDSSQANSNADPAGGTSQVESGTAMSSGGRRVSLEHLPSRPLTREEILTVLDEVLDVLRGGDPNATRVALQKLNEVLAGDHHDAEAGIAAIMEFLKSGKDAPTGEGFIVGEGGLLTESTTMRVQLMDLLGRLSRESGSGAALEAARETLRTPGSADEWAISMRNTAWLDSGSREFLADRVTAMLHHEPWRRNPSPGMLEAFDLIVHTGAINNVPELGRLIASEEPRLDRAASVAIDRLAAAKPLEFSTMLNQQPELLENMPLLRADLLSRIDLSDNAQRHEAENYLTRPDVTPEERGKFLTSLVQRGQFVSHNLTTPLIPPQDAVAANARLETLASTVNEWLKDERFIPYRTELSQLGALVNQIDDELTADAAR